MLATIENRFPWFGAMTDMGGDVLIVILFLAAFMWSIIAERWIFLIFIFPKQRSFSLQAWQFRTERRSWYAQRYREHIIFLATQALNQHISLVNTMIKLSPLLGLLGTVLGMLDVFDAVAITGSNNPRSTAAGVSKAIITTMAGMIVAISGLPLVGYLTSRIQDEKLQLENALPLDESNLDNNDLTNTTGKN